MYKSVQFFLWKACKVKLLITEIFRKIVLKANYILKVKFSLFFIYVFLIFKGIFLVYWIGFLLFVI